MKMVDAIAKQESDAKARAVGTRKRRTYSKQFKAEVAEQCLMPGASVSAIALSHGINANVIRKWLPPGPAPMARAPVLMPVTIEADAPPAMQMAQHPEAAIGVCLLPVKRIVEAPLASQS